jgi:hypothetical protein
LGTKTPPPHIDLNGTGNIPIFTTMQKMIIQNSFGKIKRENAFFLKKSAGFQEIES